MPVSQTILATSRSSGCEWGGVDQKLIREEVQRIKDSRHFRHSKRAQQFLEFVVEHTITGQEAILKERTIGVSIFGRPPDYATGDDPVVRVQAGEVRRRLGLYQAETHDARTLTIHLPTGSYAPTFEWMEHDRAVPPVSALDLTEQEIGQPHRLDPDGATKVLEPVAYATVPAAQADRRAQTIHFKWALLSLLLVAAILGAWQMWIDSTPIHKFWRPAARAGKPVLVCLSHPAFYLPSPAMFNRFQAAHPGTFETALQRHISILPLDPHAPLHWGDMEVASNAGPAIGGVRAAVQTTTLLTRLGVPFMLRFGLAATFTDSREDPTVIIGALNSNWMVALTSGQPLTVSEHNGILDIEATQNPGLIWKVEPTASGVRDYALITRMPRGPGGNFVIKVEGLTDGGTQAGVEAITDAKELDEIVRTLPKDWQRRNLQVLVSTEVIQNEPGPPKLVASHTW